MKLSFIIPTLAALLLVLPALVFADDTFVPLTSLPGITGLTSAPSLPAFLNSLYRISIGVAAVLAVGSFIYAGYKIMSSSGSVTQNKQAREIIVNTIIGLVLVLAPAVVFGVINPKILDLSLDFGNLKSNNGTGGDTKVDKLQESICKRYQEPGAQLTYVPLKENQLCSTVKGDAWAAVECCAGPTPQGQTCCGYDPGEKTVPKTDNLLGPTSYSIAFQGRDDLTGKACLMRDDQSFSDVKSCDAAYKSATGAIKTTYAVGKLCSEKASHSLTPADAAAKLKALKECPK